LASLLFILTIYTLLFAFKPISSYNNNKYSLPLGAGRL
jgi:hypothetical protein